MQRWLQNLQITVAPHYRLYKKEIMISISSVSWLCIFITLALRVKTYPAGWILYTWMSVSWYLIRTAIKPNFNCMNVKCLIHNLKHHVCGLTSILTFPEKSGQETSWEYQIQPKQRSVYPNLMDPEILSDSSPTQMWWTTWTFYWCVCVCVCVISRCSCRYFESIPANQCIACIFTSIFDY